MREDQRRIADWLTKRAPELGHVYGAVVRLIADPSDPGIRKLICQGVRDICNRLPEVVGGIFVDSPRYQENILSQLWSRHKLDRLEFEQVTLADSSNRNSATRDIAIPIDVFRQVGLLVAHYRKVPELSREIAKKMFETIAPETMGRAEIVSPQIEQWIKMKKWFQANAHAGLTDRTVDQTELQNNFEMLEIYLNKICGEEEFYTGVKTLDEILEDTNS